MGLFRSIGRAFRSVKRFAGGIIKKGLGVLGTVAKIAGPLLPLASLAIPGLGIAGLLGKFGGMGGILGKLGSTGLGKFATGLASKFSGGFTKFMGSGLGQSLSSGWGRLSGMFTRGFGGMRTRVGTLMNSGMGQRFSAWSTNLNQQLGFPPGTTQPYGAMMMANMAMPLVMGPMSMMMM